MRDKISVIMSTYNEQEFWIKQAIESILTQSYTNFEFIIVLDNPQNQLIENIVQFYSKKDPRIIIIKNTYNIGLTASLNKALQIATGKYIARMDADDKATKNRLKIQLDYLQRHHLDIVGSWLQLINENNIIIQKKIEYPILPQKTNTQLNVMNCVPHPSWFLKKEVYKTLNYYRDIYTCEDYDFLLRAKEKGYKIGNVPKVLLAYRLTSQSVSRSNLLRQYLTSRYLQNHATTINSVTINDIETYLINKVTPTASADYAKANQLFMKTLYYLDKKRFLSCFYYLIKSILCSKWIFVRMYYVLLGSLKTKFNYNVFKIKEILV